MAAKGVLSVDEDVVEDKRCILRLSLLLGMMQSSISGAQAKLEVLTCLFVVHSAGARTVSLQPSRVYILRITTQLAQKTAIRQLNFFCDAMALAWMASSDLTTILPKFQFPNQRPVGVPIPLFILSSHDVHCQSCCASDLYPFRASRQDNP